jgi:hypothetical protein
MTPTDPGADTPIQPPRCPGCGAEVGPEICPCGGGGLTVGDLLSTADAARALRCPRDKVLGLLKLNAAKYGAWLEKGGGGRAFSWRERWRIPAGAIPLMRADLTTGRAAR